MESRNRGHCVQRAHLGPYLADDAHAAGQHRIKITTLRLQSVGASLAKFIASNSMQLLRPIFPLTGCYATRRVKATDWTADGSIKHRLAFS